MTLVLDNEFHFIARRKQKWIVIIWVEEHQRCVTDETPTTGGGHGIDPGLRTSNCHRSFWYVRARYFKTWRDDCIIQLSHVRKARCKAHHIDGVCPLAMDANHIFD